MPQAIVGAGTSEAQWQAWSGWDEVPWISAAELVGGGQRTVIVAPHPDDEILGCGGLLARLAELRCEVALVAVTDGTGSHPHSRHWTAARLGEVRPAETVEALRRLHAQATPILRLGIPDGQIAAHAQDLRQALAAFLRPDDVLITTWRGDGHPDHEHTGEACLLAARDVGARYVEVPVWAWHWSAPADARFPWQRARRLALTPRTAARKRHALAAFRSQTEPDPDGAAAVLPDHVLERFRRDYEVVLV